METLLQQFLAFVHDRDGRAILILGFLFLVALLAILRSACIGWKESRLRLKQRGLRDRAQEIHEQNIHRENFFRRLEEARPKPRIVAPASEVESEEELINKFQASKGGNRGV